MKQDVEAIRQWIIATRLGSKNKPGGKNTTALYRTYLYCLRSQYRHRLHMTVWNKQCNTALRYHVPEEPFNPMDPTSGRAEFSTLDDQAKFIEHCVHFLTMKHNQAVAAAKLGPLWPWMQPWLDIRINFDKQEELVAS